MTVKPCWFITGTDTEIGKTLVASALLHALGVAGIDAAGMKPIAAGAVLRNHMLRNEDAEQLAAAAGVALSPALATPYLLREAAAPQVAAALEDVRSDVAHIPRCFQHGCQRQDFLRGDTGVVARRLRAIAAILGTATGLDRQQRGQFDFGGIEMLPMHLLRAKQQIIERQIEQRQHVGHRPDIGGYRGDGGLEGNRLGRHSEFLE